MKGLQEVVRGIETAISETDQRRSYGGHRHGQFDNVARTGFVEGWWLAYVKRKGRWRVVGRARTEQHAIRIARSKAARG